MESRYENISTMVGLSLASGALILVGGLIPLIWMQSSPFMQGMQGMMGGGMMGVTFVNMSWISILSGSIIIFSAIMINNYPRNAQLWGILILVFAVISLFNFGGFLIGAILGIIAGAMIMSKR